MLAGSWGKRARKLVCQYLGRRGKKKARVGIVHEGAYEAAGQVRRRAPNGKFSLIRTYRQNKVTGGQADRSNGLEISIPVGNGPPAKRQLNLSRWAHPTSIPCR